MTATTWKEHFELLAKEYAPLTLGKDNVDYPSLGHALDEGVERMLAAHLAVGGSEVNKRFVEELLSDCIARISNALTLREKAFDVEVRAVQEAMQHAYQSRLAASNQSISDLLAPLQATAGVNATGLKADGDGFAFVGHEEVWANVKIVQDKLATAQKALIDASLAKAITPGNGANYVERFAMLKKLFDLGLPELYGRCLACAQALKKIYAIDIAVPKVTPTGYLNQLAVWGQAASDRLDVELGQRYSGDIMFAVAGIDDNLKDGELLPRSKYLLAIPTGIVNFTVSAQHLERFKMTAPLLRSVHLHIRPKTEDGRSRIWSGTISPPDTDLTAGDEDFPCIVSSNYAQNEGETIYGVHNLNPIGDWTLRLAERGVTGDLLNGEEILNVYVRMRVSYKRRGA